jgi:hypothetical protein
MFFFKKKKKKKNQVNFSLGCDASGEEGNAPIGSIAGIDLKVALAENVICQANNHRELRGGRKGIQLQELWCPPQGPGCQTCQDAALHCSLDHRCL